MVDKQTYQIGGFYYPGSERRPGHSLSPARAYTEDPNYVKQVLSCSDCGWFGLMEENTKKCPFCGNKNLQLSRKMMRPWGFAPKDAIAIPDVQLTEEYTAVQQPLYSTLPEADEMKQKLGRPATPTEIAEACGMEKDKIETIMADDATVSSIYDKKGLADESVEIIDTIQDDNLVNPLEALVDKDVKQELQTALRRLPERERMIMVLYYHENMTLKEIGEAISISESRVCQLHAQAIMKLKNILTSNRTDRLTQSIV